MFYIFYSAVYVSLWRQEFVLTAPVLFIICAGLQLLITMIHFETKDWTVIVNNTNIIYTTTIISLVKSLNMKIPRYMILRIQLLAADRHTKWGVVKSIKELIIIPTYNSIFITGYNENRVFSYFLLQSAVMCTSLFVPYPFFF